MSLLLPISQVMGLGAWQSNLGVPGIEAASQTYKVGAPLVTSSGKLQEASANPTAIIGIALSAATGVTNSTVLYYPAVQDTFLFLISIDKASAQGGALAVLAQTNVYATFGITKDSTTGFWYLDVDKSGANQVCRVMGFPTSTPAGTVNGQCYIHWLRASSTIYV